MVDSLTFLVISMFSSGIPITIAPMIWSMAWDVMRGGWLRPTMVLGCHWRLGGTAYLVWLFFLLLCYWCLNVMWFFSFHYDVSFLFFPLLLIRWLDFPSNFSSFSLDSSVHASKRGSSTPRCGGTLFRSFLGLFLCFFLCVLIWVLARECISSCKNASLHARMQVFTWASASLHVSLCKSLCEKKF